jgi:hypothetical protein
MKCNPNCFFAMHRLGFILVFRDPACRNNLRKSFATEYIVSHRKNGTLHSGSLKN